MQSGKELLNVKQTYWNRNGIEITTINDTYPIYNEGTLIGAVELARDITTLEKFMHRPFHQPMNRQYLAKLSLNLLQ